MEATPAGNLTRIELSASGAHRVTIDGKEVMTVGDQNRLDLFRGNVNASRLGENAPPDEQPLVLVDGVAMTDGPQSLSGIPASDVVSVTTMRVTEAAPLHGPKARKGAIVVQTRRGS